VDGPPLTERPRSAQKEHPVQERTWFDNELSDGTTVATVMDDIAVTLDAGGLITIDGPVGGRTTFKFDDAVPLSAALIEGIQILRDRDRDRDRGHVERSAVSLWMREHKAS
jgi:hypothetical protein